MWRSTGRGSRATPRWSRLPSPGRAAPTPPPAATDRGRPETGRNLLFGLLALQNNFIDRDALLAAFNTWVADKSRPLGGVLLDRGALDVPRHALLEALVGEHLKLHGGDPERSLAALAVGGSTRLSLKGVGDPDLDASLAHAATAVPAGGDDVTAVYAVGTTTALGRRFRALRPHARGGLGAVFVALDSELNREVALKEILVHYADDPVSRQRFLLEAEITGGLEHPGIVPVYGLGHYADGRPYYAMRFIRGDSLKNAVAAFHADPALRRDPAAARWRCAAPAAVHRRLQRDRVRAQPGRAPPRHQAGQREAIREFYQVSRARPGRPIAPSHWPRRALEGTSSRRRVS